MTIKNLCWIRRDLRLHDHYALSSSLKNGDETYVVFIFDPTILSKLANTADRRVTFIMDSLLELEEAMNEHAASLIIRFGDPQIEIPKLCDELKINTLYFNRDYEPKAKKRDESVTAILHKKGIDVQNFKDHVIFEKDEVLNGKGEVYKVFTPYKNKWLETLSAQEFIVQNYKCNLKKLAPNKTQKKLNAEEWYKKIGFEETKALLPGGSTHALKRLKNFKKDITLYKEARDIPSLNKTSNLSPYIRMGNISIRDMVRLSLEDSNEGSRTFLSELIWRDFYQVILDVYPNIETHCFKLEYDKIKWVGSPKHFKLWCEGMTGYPIVDAAMRCFNQTGMMHNRLRMVVASFLTKTLLIDWRLGEQYFAERLLDYDMAANNGGWQWSASTGVDAQPYFRIFNPYNQSEKFDTEGLFIKSWCPELKNLKAKDVHNPIGVPNYPRPIVIYKEQKEKALAMFKAVK